MIGGIDMGELPYLKAERDRQGRIGYWYFRRNGRRWRLPGERHSEEWLAEYARRKAQTDAEAKPACELAAYPPKSIGALALDYYASPEFRARKPSTQRMYRRCIDAVVKDAGHVQAAMIERRHVKAMRDERADTPGMANMVVNVVRLLMTYAVDNGYRKDNPALRIKPFKLGEHRAWEAGELEAFERHWPPGSMQRRAYALARYTGQRCGDLAAMTRAHRQDGAIRVKQQKTGTELWVREHRELTAELARGEQGHMSLLVKVDGGGFDADSLRHWMAAAIDAAGLPGDCVLHGLRKVAARDLAEAGCSAHEIMSVTGHASLKEVERYTRAASRKRLAGAAILKLERAGKQPRA